MPSLHSRLAASASSRWVRCTGSIALIEKLRAEKKIPQESTNPAAQLGTLCHEILEYCVIRGIDPVTLSKKTIKSITPEDLTHITIEHFHLVGVSKYWEYIEDLKPKFDETFAERRYDMSDLYGIDLGGTADVTQCKLEETLHIGDYKNGRTPVDHIDNYQLKIYGLGALHALDDMYKFEDVMMSIGQPNSFHTDGPIRQDVIPVKELYDWEETVLRPAVENIKTGNTTLVAGEKQCEWCDAKKFCKEYAKWTTNIAETEFEDFVEPDIEISFDIEIITDEEAQNILDKEPQVLELFKQLKERASACIEETGRFGEYIHESKPGNRRYISDEKDLKYQLARRRIHLWEVFEKPPRKMVSITKLEGYLRTKKKWSSKKVSRFLERITYRPTSNPKLVKRKCNAETEFAEFKPGKKPTSKKVKTRKRKLSRKK